MPFDLDLFYGGKLDIFKDLLPMIKNHVELPHRFLKIGSCLIWINFLADETRQSKTLA